MTIDEIKRDMSRRLLNATNKTYQDGVRIIEDSFDTFMHKVALKDDREQKLCVVLLTIQNHLYLLLLAM